MKISTPESTVADTISGIWPRAPTFLQKILPLIRHVGSVERDGLINTSKINKTTRGILQVDNKQSQKQQKNETKKT